jgi:hypothetical protein
MMNILDVLILDLVKYSKRLRLADERITQYR